jgi:hypothetical protein
MYFAVNFCTIKQYGKFSTLAILGWAINETATNSNQEKGAAPIGAAPLIALKKVVLKQLKVIGEDSLLVLPYLHAIVSPSIPHHPVL